MSDAAERQLKVLANSLVDVINVARQNDPSIGTSTVFKALVATLASVIGGSSETRKDANELRDAVIGLLRSTVAVAGLKADMKAKVAEMTERLN